MLNHELRQDDGILVLKPEGPLEATDFAMVTGQVDAYLEQHGTLRDVLMRAKSFPGWKDFGALLAHLKFVKAHHQRIEKVAVVSVGAFANIVPRIGSHFIHAKLQHFDFEREDAAWDRLKQSSVAQARSAA